MKPWKFSSGRDLGYDNIIYYYKILLEQGNFSRIINEPALEESDFIYDISVAAAHFALGQTNRGEEIIKKVIAGNKTHMYWIAFAYSYGDNPDNSSAIVKPIVFTTFRRFSLITYYQPQMSVNMSFILYNI